MHFAKLANHPFDLVVYNVLATNNFAIGKFPTCKKTTRWEQARFATRWISIYYRNTWFPTGQYNARLEPVCFVIEWISVYCEITWFQAGQCNVRWEPLSCGAQMIDSLFILEKRCPVGGEPFCCSLLSIILLCSTILHCSYSSLCFIVVMLHCTSLRYMRNGSLWWLIIRLILWGIKFWQATIL